MQQTSCDNDKAEMEVKSRRSVDGSSLFPKFSSSNRPLCMGSSRRASCSEMCNCQWEIKGNSIDGCHYLFNSFLSKTSKKINANGGRRKSSRAKHMIHERNHAGIHFRADFRRRADFTEVSCSENTSDFYDTYQSASQAGGSDTERTPLHYLQGQQVATNSFTISLNDIANSVPDIPVLTIPATTALPSEKEESILETLREIVRKCTINDPSRRPKAKEILRMISGLLTG